MTILVIKVIMSLFILSKYNMWQEQFLKDGYVILDIRNKESLYDLRRDVYIYLAGVTDVTEANIDDYFNNYHKFGLSNEEVNNVIKNLVFEYSKDNKLNRSIFNLIENELTLLLGADILGQKRANFVAHLPNNSINNAPVHRDSPENSQFEIVCWLPLVDTYSTKTMGILNKIDSKKAIQILFEKSNDEYLKFYRKNAIEVNVSFGGILLFHPNIIHGPFDNIENETRFSINIRYKNLFSPPGEKNVFDFFEVMTMSALTKLGIEASVNEGVFKK